MRTNEVNMYPKFQLRRATLSGAGAKKLSFVEVFCEFSLSTTTNANDSKLTGFTEAQSQSLRHSHIGTVTVTEKQSERHSHRQ